MLIYTLVTIIATAMMVPVNAYAKTYESEGQKFVIEKFYEGSDVIWGFDFINPSSAEEIIFTERQGALKFFNFKNNKAINITGVPNVFAKGQGGLLDIYIDHKNKDYYLTYSEPVDGKGTTSLFKGKFSEDKTKIEGKRIFQAKAFASAGEHFGSRVVIDKEGYLFMTVGERNQRDQAQMLTSHQGKVLRLTNEGLAPKDNPFVNIKDALPEIWSYGHRNPQGIVLDGKETLLVAEFGPRGGDEVNLITKGANYGWPVATYGKEYWGPSIGVDSKFGMTQPLYHWVPSINPSGMMIYTGKKFLKFQNNLFLATLANGHIHRIVVDEKRKIIKEENLLGDLNERFRQIKMGPDGLIYISTDSGRLYRIRPI